MNPKNVSVNSFSFVNQQARLLMVENRKRQQSRQGSMLERVSSEIGIK